MDYHLHDIGRAGVRSYFNMLAGMNEVTAAAVRMAQGVSLFPSVLDSTASHFNAAAVMMRHLSKDYPDPGFNLDRTVIGGRTVAVEEEEILDRPFCTLKHFKRDSGRSDPKVLLVAPMSGHYASLLRDTAAALLPHHDIYITDWKNARDVPVNEDDNFGLSDYISYVRDFIRELGPDTHVMAVCQPTVPVMAAVSAMEAEKDPARPLSMTMMAGPLDTRAAPTEVTEFAQKHSIDWFRSNVIRTVPPDIRAPVGKFILDIYNCHYSSF